MFKDTFAIFAAFAALFLLAVTAEAPLERLADPTDTTYIPRPDWYFLFLFQLLKLFQGPLEVLASTVLPMAAVAALFAVPFVDRSRLRRVTERTAALSVVALVGLTWTGLTVAAVVTSPRPLQRSASGGVNEWQALSPEELAGIGYFRRENCAACHTVGEGGVKIGPDLAPTALRNDAAWMIAHFKNPAEVVPGSSMPPIQLSDAQLNALAAFLLQLTPRNARALISAPDFAVEGAMIYQANRCGGCHIVNGVGVKVGPPLNGLRARRSREWVIAHFLDPQKLSPGTLMPPYRFSPREMERITNYLMSLP